MAILPGSIRVVFALPLATGSFARVSTAENAAPDTVIDPASAVAVVSFAAFRSAILALAMIAFLFWAAPVIAALEVPPIRWSMG